MVLYFGREKLKELGPVVPGDCHACGRETWAHLIKRRKWLTLFSLPLIPLRPPSYHVYCEQCMATREIRGDDVDAAKEQIESTRRFVEGEVSWEEYTDRLEDFSASVDDELATAADEERKQPRGYA